MSLETILVAVDTDDSDAIESVVETAVDIAEPAGAEIVVGYVFSNGEYDTARERLQFDPDSEVTPDVVAERMVGVRELTELLAEAGIAHRVRGRLANGGDDGELLAELGNENAVDLAVVGGRGRTPAGKAVFGSTAQTLMLSADYPVTYVRTE